MTRVQTIVQLTSDLISALDAEAEATGTSRSSVIRQAITDHLEAGREAHIDAAMINGYATMPQGAADEWGSVLEQSRHNTRRTLGRLDAEEEAAGTTW
jgi:predicted transcriptional regulator